LIWQLGGVNQNPTSDVKLLFTGDRHEKTACFNAFSL